MFVTYTNVRGYEWGVKEVGVLVEDLMDAALGSLGGEQTTTMRDGDNGGGEYGSNAAVVC